MSEKEESDLVQFFVDTSNVFLYLLMVLRCLKYFLLIS